MNREDIIRMAREATLYTNNQTDVEGYNWDLIRDEYFANLVAQYEREQCAVAAEKQARWIGYNAHAEAIAADDARGGLGIPDLSQRPAVRVL